MRAWVANSFRGYEDFEIRNAADPIVSDGKLLVRMIAAGVTPLDYTILHDKIPITTAPLILGNEGSGVIVDGDEDFPSGTRVVFCGPFGLLEQGTYAELIAVPKDLLYRVPDNIDLVAAAGLPVAYLTSYLALQKAGFKPGKIVLAPAIGGSVGNATAQLALALGAKVAVTTSTAGEKVLFARQAGFDHVIDLNDEALGDGVMRMTDGYGVDIVIDGLGGTILSSASKVLAPGGAIISIGYSAGRETTIDVMDLIWKVSRIQGFSLLAEDVATRRSAWDAVSGLLAQGKIRPFVAKTFEFNQAKEALKYLIEDRPFGRVILTV